MARQKQVNPQHKTAIKGPGGKRPVKVPKQPNMTGAYPIACVDVKARVARFSDPVSDSDCLVGPYAQPPARL